jgi:hypothetical protein
MDANEKMWVAYDLKNKIKFFGTYEEVQYFINHCESAQL